jgi:hypothetical protein
MTTFTLLENKEQKHLKIKNYEYFELSRNQ